MPQRAVLDATLQHSITKRLRRTIGNRKGARSVLAHARANLGLRVTTARLEHAFAAGNEIQRFVARRVVCETTKKLTHAQTIDCERQVYPGHRLRVYP